MRRKIGWGVDRRGGGVSSLGRGLFCARGRTSRVVDSSRAGGTSRFYSNCVSFLHATGARHRTARCFIRGTRGLNFGPFIHNRGCGYNSGMCLGGHNGTIVLYMVKGRPIRGKVHLSTTRVSSPHLSLGPGPLCRSGRLTCFGARCCNNVGGCR